MKILFNLGIADPDPLKCFTTQHMLTPLKDSFDLVDNVYDCDKVVFLDFGHVDHEIKKNICIQAKSLNKEVIITTFDPANFSYIKHLEEESLFSRVVVFDQQFSTYFANSIVSDYWLNDTLFPKEFVDKNGVCTFGHLECGRTLPPQVTKVDSDKIDLVSLYNKVSRFSGVVVFDSGVCNGSIIHHNKAKSLEALLCGCIPFCKEGISSPVFGRFFKKFEEYTKPIRPFSEIEEVSSLNKVTIDNFIKLIKG